MKKFILSAILLPLSLISNEFVTDFHLRGGVPTSILVDGRYACYETEQHTLFANIKGGISSTTNTYTPGSKSSFLEGNVGLGYRFSHNTDTFGVYSYYGKLRTPYHDHFSRATVGLEYFNDVGGAFINFYTPIGKRTQTIARKYGFNRFQFNFKDHDLHFVNYGKQEVMSPLASEFGVHKNFGIVDALLKGYYHAGYKETNRRIGTNIELSSKLSDCSSITLSAGYDTFYKSQLQLGFFVSFGNTTSMNEGVCNIKQQRLPPVHLEEFFWVQRGKQVFNDNIVKSNLYFVDNSKIYVNGFQGDGTFQTPFSNALVANNAITTVPDATLYFYQGNDQYQNFGTFNLIENQRITGQAGNLVVQNIVVLPGSPATRPILVKNALQEMLNTPLITVTDGGSNIIENIGLANASGNVATGGSLITLAGSSLNSLTIQNITATDKVTLFFTSGNQSVNVYNNDIFGVDIKTFNSAAISLRVENNIFRTNKMIAQRFFQPIGASLFLESLNNSTFVVDTIKNNRCFNTTLNGNAHLGFGYLSSGTSINITPNGFLNNSSIGKLPPASAGAFLFQGVDASRVNINGCTNNFSLLDGFTLQRCDINIKKVGVTADPAGMSQANNNTVVAPFALVVITNTP